MQVTSLKWFLTRLFSISPSFYLRTWTVLSIEKLGHFKECRKAIITQKGTARSVHSIAKKLLCISGQESNPYLWWVKQCIMHERAPSKLHDRLMRELEQISHLHQTHHSLGSSPSQRVAVYVCTCKEAKRELGKSSLSHRVCTEMRRRVIPFAIILFTGLPTYLVLDGLVLCQLFI